MDYKPQSVVRLDLVASRRGMPVELHRIRRSQVQLLPSRKRRSSGGEHRNAFHTHSSSTLLLHVLSPRNARRDYILSRVRISPDTVNEVCSSVVEQSLRCSDAPQSPSRHLRPRHLPPKPHTRPNSRRMPVGTTWSSLTATPFEPGLVAQAARTSHHSRRRTLPATLTAPT